MAGALRYAEQAVDYADRSKDAFERMAMRTTHADALYQTGQLLAASVLFAEAERMQAEWQPTNPLLYSLQGFRYGEVLLAAPEAAAWLCSVAVACGRPASLPALGAAPQAAPSAQLPSASELAAHLSSCDLLLVRVAQTLKIAERNNWLLSISLDHLSLARTKLYTTILANQPPALGPQVQQAQQHLQKALDGLRRAGAVEFLLPGLLTQAWLLSHIGQHIGPDSAQSTLDEAWEIAERGPMPLFMADIHLYRAAFFSQVQPYPWQSAEFDRQEARRLIIHHGYLRRLPALEVLEQLSQ